MTEELVVESAQEVQEPTEQPVPVAPSVPSGDKPTLPASSDDDVLERLAQSIKDKRFASQEKEIGEIKSSISHLTDLLEKGQAPAQEVQGRTGGVDEWAYAEAMSAQSLAEAGLANDDAEYTALAERYAGKVTPEQWVDIADKHCRRRATKKDKQAGVTEAAGATAAGTVVEVSDEADMASLTKRLEEIQTSGLASVDPQLKEERAKIIERMEELVPQEKIGIL